MSVCLPIMQRAGVPSRQMTAHHSAGVKRVGPQGTGAYARQVLPTDVFGIHVLTLVNVATGSRVAIYDQAGTVTLHDQIASGGPVVISLPVYSPGSARNDLRIKVRKASGAPHYQPYETLTTVAIGSSSIYVSQIPDE